MTELMPLDKAERQSPHPAATIILGMAPWLAAWCGSYVLHSAIASFFFYHTLCLSSAVIFRHRFGPRSSKPFPRRHWIALAAGCLAACVLVYFMIGLLGYLAEPARVIAGLRRQHIPLTQTSYVLLFSYFAVVNPIAEEFFWRGTIYSGLRRRHLGIRLSSNLSAFLFGSWHFLIIRLFFPTIYAVAITVGIVFIGELLGRFYERTRSLPAACLLHGLGADVPVLVILWFGVLSK
jgi:membrane protease YdiL (CAAX protease family)